jgi:hypothetical protein
MLIPGCGALYGPFDWAGVLDVDVGTPGAALVGCSHVEFPVLIST